jgi:septal ring factor EnvC (AmiA/AmiB activator)
MRVLISGLIMSTALVVAGCAGEDDRSALREQELERELSLALDAHRLAEARLDLNDAALEEAPAATAPAAARPAPQRQAAPRAQTRPAQTRQVSTAPAPAPQPRVVTETNVKRDAAIGGAVGAAAGAIIHKPNRVKGAVVGGVIGAATGAVIGATVDKKTTVVYDFRP